MTTRNIILAAVVLLSSFQAFAFNKERCGTIFPKSDGTHPPYYAPLYVSTMVPSTTSYFSSLGACAMYGDANRSAFIEETLKPLQAEAAQGSGEYLNALSSLSGCPASENKNFGLLMQNRFEEIFVHEDTPSIGQKIDFALRSSNLGKTCARLEARLRL